MKLLTVNTAPPDVLELPGYAVQAFLSAANSLLELDLVSHSEAVEIGRREAELVIERREAEKLRTDRGFVGRVERTDTWTIRLDESTVVRHENGWVDMWGVATRVGIFDYEDPSMPGGIYRELRPFDEVMDPASLATLFGVPFTILHPEEEVTSANTRDLAHGVVLEVAPKGDLVWVRIRVWSDEAKAAIAGGMIELSCGYSTVLDETPGTTEGGDGYDGIQRQIRYDHLALVDLARAGHVARLRLDGYRCSRRAASEDEKPMKKFTIRIDSRDFPCPAFLVPMLKSAHVDTIKARQDAKRNKRADLAVGEVTITPGEGEEPVTLVLPMATVEEILGMLGAMPPATEPPPEEPPAEEPPAEGEDGDMPGEEQEEDEADPPAGAPPAAPTAGRSDGFTDAQMKLIDKRVDSRLAEERKRHDAEAKRRADAERKASRVLDSGFEWHKHDTEGIKRATIGHVFPERDLEAQGLAERSRKGDGVARGSLDMLFAFACDKAKADRQDEADEVSGALDALGGSDGDGDSEQRSDSGDGDGDVDFDLDPVRSAKQRFDGRLRTGTIDEGSDE